MKKITMFLVAAVALVSGAFAPKSAEAVPAFARQVGVPCFSCHYQFIPKLNSFGREFRLGGYTQSAQDLITDEGMSLPPAFGGAFIIKYRFTPTQTSYPATTGDKVGRERGEWDLYDEAALWIAGRVAENVGFAAEMPGPSVSTKAIFSKNFGGVQGGLVAYQTDALGAAFGMELYNTGAVGNVKGWESASYVFPARILGGPGRSAASGLSVFAGSSLFFLNVGLFGPATTVDGGTVAASYAGTDYAISALDAGFEMPFYYRIAVTPKVADGLDLMVGLQGTSGKGKLSGGLGIGLITVECDTMAIDAQVQTDVAGMSLEVTAAYQKNGKKNSNMVNQSAVAAGVLAATAVPASTDLGGGLNGVADAHALGVQANLGLSKALGLKASYLSGGSDATGGTTATYMGLGLWYNIAQNVHITPEYIIGSDSGRDIDSRLQIMFMVGL